MLQLTFLGLALDILAGFSFASDCKASLASDDMLAKYQHIVFIEIVFVALVVDDRHQHLHLDVPSGRPCHS